MNEIIVRYRKNLGLTQEALAQRLGVTNQAVSKWESGQSCPDIALLPALADIFGITLDQLFGREPKAVSFPAQPPYPWPDDDTLRVVLYIGHRQIQSSPAADEIHFCYEGTALNIESAVNVTCDAVMGNVTAGGDVNCDDVFGHVQAGGTINCDNVKGNISAQGGVNCDDVAGSVNAGGNVACDCVEGSVHAGGNVQADEIHGSTITAGGGVSCDHWDR